MGHYWRDMDPKGAEESDNEMEKAVSFREKISKVSLANFSVEDLPALLRILECEPYNDDIKKIQEKLK